LAQAVRGQNLKISPYGALPMSRCPERLKISRPHLKLSRSEYISPDSPEQMGTGSSAFSSAFDCTRCSNVDRVDCGAVCAPTAPCSRLMGSRPPGFGKEAEDVLEDDAITYVKVQSQRMLQRLGQLAAAEEKDAERMKAYHSTLQQVFELITAAVCDVSGGHMLIAVLPEAEFDELEIQTVDNGLLTKILYMTSIYDKMFQKRVWFYKSWVHSSTCLCRVVLQSIIAVGG